MHDIQEPVGSGVRFQGRQRIDAAVHVRSYIQGYFLFSSEPHNKHATISTRPNIIPQSEAQSLDCFRIVRAVQAIMPGAPLKGRIVDQQLGAFCPKVVPVESLWGNEQEIEVAWSDRVRRKTAPNCNPCETAIPRDFNKTAQHPDKVPPSLTVAETAMKLVPGAWVESRREPAVDKIGYSHLESIDWNQELFRCYSDYFCHSLQTRS
jgi:hypothetical protein